MTAALRLCAAWGTCRSELHSKIGSEVMIELEPLGRGVRELTVTLALHKALYFLNAYLSGYLWVWLLVEAVLCLVHRRKIIVFLEGTCARPERTWHVTLKS